MFVVEIRKSAGDRGSHVILYCGNERTITLSMVIIMRGTGRRIASLVMNEQNAFFCFSISFPVLPTCDINGIFIFFAGYIYPSIYVCTRVFIVSILNLKCS